MRACLAAFFTTALLWFGPAQPASFIALSYHDVVASSDERRQPEDVDVYTLAQHFTWLREAGYHVVSLQDIVQARAGRRPLPDRAVLLTFDDGYRSFYARVYPLLQAFRYPAVLALVASWLEAPSDAWVQYDGRWVPRTEFMSWEQVREVTASGLVEVASHSFDLHRAVIGNAAGNVMPAAVARIFDARTGRLESFAEYEARITHDLHLSRTLLELRTGAVVRTMVWPYGRYSGRTLELARAAGMPLTLTLDQSDNDEAVPLARIGRRLVVDNPNVADFAAYLQHGARRERQHALALDLHDLVGATPAETERNLSALLPWVHDSGASHVVLNVGPRADHPANFRIDGAPLPQDALNRIAWQLAKRAGVGVIARLDADAACRVAERHGLPAVSVYEGLARTIDLAGFIVRSGCLPLESIVRVLQFWQPWASVHTDDSANDNAFVTVDGALEAPAATAQHLWRLQRAGARRISLQVPAGAWHKPWPEPVRAAFSLRAFPGH